MPGLDGIDDLMKKGLRRSKTGSLTGEYTRDGIDDLMKKGLRLFLAVA